MMPDLRCGVQNADVEMTRQATPTSRTVRLNLSLSKSLHADLTEMAESAGVSMSDVIRQGVALLKVAIDAKGSGLHIGLCDDPMNLDREIIGLI